MNDSVMITLFANDWLQKLEFEEHDEVVEAFKVQLGTCLARVC